MKTDLNSFSREMIALRLEFIHTRLQYCRYEEAKKKIVKLMGELRRNASQPAVEDGRAEKVQNCGIMEIDEMLEFLLDCQRTHREWAQCFERDPEKEHAMVGTGEWDNAETHRKIEKKYEVIINYLMWVTYV